jgi:hypothetical protein
VRNIYSALAIVPFLLSGCRHTPANGPQSVAQSVEQEGQATDLLQQQEGYLARTGELLTAQEKQLERNEKLLDKMEEQARRKDAILDAEEKRLGIKPPSGRPNSN